MFTGPFVLFSKVLVTYNYVVVLVVLQVRFQRDLIYHEATHAGMKAILLLRAAKDSSLYPWDDLTLFSHLDNETFEGKTKILDK
jgi:hypothetical protein